MGRGTYEKVLTFDPWPYPDHQVVVLNSTLPPDVDPRTSVVSSVEDAVALLDQRGSRGVYIDGGVTVQTFLAAGLIDELIITRAPVLLGDGLPLFGRLDHDIQLKLKAVSTSTAGYTHAAYDVVR